MSSFGPAVLQSIRDPFYIVSSNHKILWMNRSLGSIYRVKPDDAIGKQCHRAFHNINIPCQECMVKKVLDSGRTHITEKSRDLDNGTRKTGEVRGYPIRGDDNSIVAIIIIVFDITKKTEELEKQKDYNKFLNKKLFEKAGEEQEVFFDKEETSINVNLSGREFEVLRLIAEGFTNVQISKLLKISSHTVKSHIINIFNKLGVNDRTQAAVLATKNKII